MAADREGGAAAARINGDMRFIFAGEQTGSLSMNAIARKVSLAQACERIRNVETYRSA